LDFIRLKRIGSERIDSERIDSERIDHTKEYQLAGRKQIAELVDIRLKHLKEDTGPITGEEQKMRLYRNGTDICFDKAHDMITHEIKYVRLIPPVLNDQRLFRTYRRAFSATDTFFIINHGSFKILLAQSADGTCLYRGTFVVLRAVLFSDF